MEGMDLFGEDSVSGGEEKNDSGRNSNEQEVIFVLYSSLFLCKKV